VRHGWTPAEKEFKRDDAEREFLPLTDEVLIAHLSQPADERANQVNMTLLSNVSHPIGSRRTHLAGGDI
jgi:hypothetical protein